MRAWAFMLGGLLVWAGHFFTVYIAASLFHTSPAARLITAAATLAGLAAAAAIGHAGWRGRRTEGDEATLWIPLIAALASAAAFVAILWQGLPALLI